MSSLPKVALVGAGPGDPGLITVRGRELLEQAEVVIYDYLANPALLAYVPAAAERYYVGKKTGDDPRAQDGITELLLAKARDGKRVVRLKGGDPFIFGRGGEEAEALTAAGIPYEIVPGITAGYAVPAYAGIPMTHREFSSSVTFVTGHSDPLAPDCPIRWDKVAAAGGTLVIYMSWRNLAAIARALVDFGRSPLTPAAVIQWGSTPRQRTVTGTLADIAQRVEQAGLKPPTITVVGEVAALKEKLAWYEKLPLFGRRIVVTRAMHQAGALASGLRLRGAMPLELPTIELCDAGDPAPLLRAIADIQAYDWVLFTSANAVERFFVRLWAAGSDARAIRGRVCAIGPATAGALRDNGVLADRVAAEYRAEGVLEALAAGESLAGKRVLIPRAAVARDLLPRELEIRGAKVDVVEVYRTAAVAHSPERIQHVLDEAPDLITFTSSSTVQNCPVELRSLPAASIGPITTETAKTLGFNVVVEAAEYTIEGLLAALERHFLISSS